MTTRTDPHSPANLDPAEYTYLGYADLWAEARHLSARENQARASLIAKAETHGIDGNFAAKGSCDHCGVAFRYGVFVRHTSGDVLVIGHQCAAERFELSGKLEWDRKRLESSAKAQRTKAANAEWEAAFRAAHPELAEAMYAEPQDNVRHPALARHDILGDMSHQLRRKGRLSDKQVAFAARLWEETAPGAKAKPVEGEPAPSEAQLRFARTLCEERGLDPEVELAGLGRRSISAKIDELKKAPRKEAARKPELRMPEVDEGRYAIEADGDWKFYQVDRPTEGRWEGYVFVNQLVGAPGDWNRIAVRAPSHRLDVLAAIARNPEAAMVAFGRESGICGACGSPLSDPVSRAAGIGPVCADNRGVSQRELAASNPAPAAPEEGVVYYDNEGNPLPF